MPHWIIELTFTGTLGSKKSDILYIQIHTGRNKKREKLKQTLYFQYSIHILATRLDTKATVDH